MSQLQRVTGVATSIRTEGRWTHIRYHSTDVVSFNGTSVVLRSGGWETATTRTRMNQASNQFNLGFRVYADKRVWYVRTTATGQAQPFVDGMTIPQVPVRWTGEAWVAAEAEEHTRDWGDDYDETREQEKAADENP